MSDLLQDVKSAVVSTINDLVPELVLKIKENIIQELGENKLKAVSQTQGGEDWRVRTLKIINAFSRLDFAQARAFSTSDAPGWVPEEFSKRVIEVIGLENPFRQFATVLPVTLLKGKIPRFLADIDVDRVPEGGAYSEAVVIADKLDYAVEKFGKIIPLTKELMDLSNPNIVEILIKAVGRGFAKKERNLFVNGSGTNEPKGIRSETYTSPITFTGADSVIEAYYSLDPQYRDRAVWLTSKKGVLVLRKLKDSMGRYLWEDGFGKAPATIMDRPVYEIPEIPSNLGAGHDETEIYFGDFSYYYIFDYGTLESSENDVLGWKNDVFYLKFVKYFDGKMAYFAEGVNVVKIAGVK
jgi:HK97 family phage major capsid protein